MTEWFKNIFGFPESAAAVYRNIHYSETENGVILTDDANGKKFQAGIFKAVSVKDFAHLTPRGNGKLHVIKGNGDASRKRHLVDVFAAQQHPDNNGATYQAASNFNSLEFATATTTAAKGITNYPNDETQGPYCAIACGASILFRNYFMKVPGSRHLGQLSKELNLLDETPIHVEHGYAIIGTEDSKRLDALKFDWSDLGHYKVGMHSNCEVTTCRKRGQFLPLETETKQVAHHVYCAAFNLLGSVAQTPFTRGVSERIIEAEYRATILCAWDNAVRYRGRAGSNKLFLTLVGCGVFNNPVTVVCAQIAKCVELIVESGLDVFVVCYDRSSFCRVEPLLKSVVAKCGGQIISAE